MIDMNKPSFLEEYTARAMGGAIGATQGRQFANKAYQAKLCQEKYGVMQNLRCIKDKKK